MTFLIISDNEQFIAETAEKTAAFESKSKTYTSDFNPDNLEKIRKCLKELSFCIIFSKNQKKITCSQAANLAFISGFLASDEVPVVTNIDFIVTNPVITKSSIKKLETEGELFDYLKKQRRNILSKSEKLTAKKALLKKGIPCTPDCFAAFIAKNKESVFNLFISAGIDVNSRDDSGTPMLNIAVRNGNEDFTTKLLDLGADINAVSNDRGYTAVMDAVWKGNKDITKLLIERGAELNTINKEGQSNLVLAVGANNADICRMLADNGADPDIKDQMGMSAYNYASLFKKEKLLEILRPYHKE